MKKKDKAYGALVLYVLADKAFVVARAITPMRFCMTTEPVDVFDYKNREEFLAAVKRAADRGIPNVAMPPEEELFWHEDGMPGLKNPIELKYAGVNSWEELERKSIYFTVDCYDRGFVVISCGRNKNGLWNDETVLELRLPAEVGLEGVVDAIMENLRNRSDLPGFTLNPSQR